MEHNCNKSRTDQVVVPLVRRDSIGSSHHLLTFEFPEPLQASPGQFAMVRGQDWGKTPFLPRPMSILEAGKRPTILVRVVGDATRRLARALPGDLFTVLAPLGRGWTSCPPDRVAVLVAGGVGLCPLLCLARSLGSASNRPLALYGGKTVQDMALEDDLRAVADVQVATEDGSAGHHGLVTDLLAPVLEKLGARAMVYTCGPDRMMAKVSQICESMLVPCEASLETRMGCGYGVCLGCAVPKREGGYLYACSEGPCIDSRLIRWEV